MSLTSDSSPTPLPDDETLHRGLASILCTADTGICQSDFQLLRRKYNQLSSTYPSETVKCQMKNGRILHLHCKYSNEQRLKRHRKAILHEARVYKQILQGSSSKTPHYYGIYNDLRNGTTWLVLEHIDNALSVCEYEYGLLHAARWLGNFHRENTEHHTAHSILEKYAATYFLKWAQQTKSFIPRSQNDLGWLKKLCSGYEERLNILLSAEQTIIHGEFYPANILIRGETVYPIDWESAAIAAGEVDLAALTEGWPDPFAKRCITEYQKYRWPEGTPANFPEALSMARTHWQLRWLGDNANWGKQKKLWHLTILKQEGEQLGLI